MLHSACILTFYTVSCATYTDCVLCVLYTACWILHTAYTAHTVFSTAHSVLCTVPGSVPRGACLEERKLPRGCQEAALRWLCPGRPGQPARPGSQSVRFPRVNTPPLGCAFDVQMAGSGRVGPAFSKSVSQTASETGNFRYGIAGSRCREYP